MTFYVLLDSLLLGFIRRLLLLILAAHETAARPAHIPVRRLPCPASVDVEALQVRFNDNKYSVDMSAAGQPVEIHAYAACIAIRKDGEIVGEHACRFGRGQTTYDTWH